MKLGKILLASALLCAMVEAASGQGIRSVRINEVLVRNTDGYVDDYGHRSSWVELCNTGHSSVDLAGSYLKLVSDNGEVVEYKIPKHDPKTLIPPLGYAVFFADGTGPRNTFHTNFVIEGKGKLQFFDASSHGKPVSEVYFDAGQAAEDVSMGWFVKAQGEQETWVANLPHTTPGGSNNTIEFIPRSELFRIEDPHGLIMSIMAMSVVFLALVFLYMTFRSVSRLMQRMSSRKDTAHGAAAASSSKTEPTAVPKQEHIPGEIIAVIGLALKQYEKDLHDMDSTVLTINRVAKAYSPWSSKIYGLMNSLPVRIKK